MYLTPSANSFRFISFVFVVADVPPFASWNPLSQAMYYNVFPAINYAIGNFMQ